MTRFRSLASAALILVTTGALILGADTAMATAGGGNVRYSLNGIGCSGGSFCWIVGSVRLGPNDTKNYVLRWNGTSWLAGAAPNPGGAPVHQLMRVDCLSPKLCFAVGSRVGVTSGGFATFNQILRWNGSSWVPRPTPQPKVKDADSHEDQLSSVFCNSPGYCWAFGTYRYDVDSEWNQALFGNIATWHLRSVPQPAGTHGGDDMLVWNQLNGVACGDNFCWAVGTDAQNQQQPKWMNQALMWNGSKWSSATLPVARGQLKAVTCLDENCWAVGSTTGQRAEVFFMSSTRDSPWVTQKISTSIATNLRGVRCLGINDCWAAGSKGKEIAVAHWNGTAWSAASAPKIIGKLNGIACSHRGACWAVGSTAKYQPIILHKVGNSWVSHWNLLQKRYRRTPAKT